MNAEDFPANPGQPPANLLQSKPGRITRLAHNKQEKITMTDLKTEVAELKTKLQELLREAQGADARARIKYQHDLYGPEARAAMTKIWNKYEKKRQRLFDKNPAVTAAIDAEYRAQMHAEETDLRKRGIIA